MSEANLTPFVSPTFASRMRRLGTILACLAAIVLFLLLPPAWVPYGVLAWVSAMILIVRRAGLIGVSAVVLFILILAKQLYMPWSAWLVEAALAMLGTIGLLAARFKVARGWIVMSVALAWLSATWLFYDYEFRSRYVVLSRDASAHGTPVVCVGDSLTAYGTRKFSRQ